MLLSCGALSPTGSGGRSCRTHDSAGDPCDGRFHHSRSFGAEIYASGPGCAKYARPHQGPVTARRLRGGRQGRSATERDAGTVRRDLPDVQLGEHSAKEGLHVSLIRPFTEADVNDLVGAVRESHAEVSPWIVWCRSD